MTMGRGRHAVIAGCLALSSVLELELVSLWMGNVWHDVGRASDNLPLLVSTVLSAWSRVMDQPWELAVAAIYLLVAVYNYRRRADGPQSMIAYVITWISFTTLAAGAALLASLPYRYCCFA